MSPSPLTVELPRFSAPAMDTIVGAAGAMPSGRFHLLAADILLTVVSQPNTATNLLEVLSAGRATQLRDRLGDLVTAASGGVETYGEIDLPGGATIQLAASARE